jgi:hypothetical protein
MIILGVQDRRYLGVYIRNLLVKYKSSRIWIDQPTIIAAITL